MAKRTGSGPQFTQYFESVIDALKELGGSGRPAEVKDIIAEKLNVSDIEQEDLTKSGVPRFSNQIDWARFYLARAGYIDSSVRGVWSLSEKGRQTESIDRKTAIGIFKQVREEMSVEQSGIEPKPHASADTESQVPETGDYQTELMAVLQSLPAPGFERLCQRLLRESGFERVTVTGRTGDGGIDGIGVLQMTPFVSFKVLFQCKRYIGTVSASQVRDFRGAMMGRADKGIIMTTGSFSRDAKSEAVRDGVVPIELVDGEKLVDLFESLELGLKPKKAFDVDYDFFEEFR